MRQLNYCDKIETLDYIFKDSNEIDLLFSEEKTIRKLVENYGLALPFYFEVNVAGNEMYYHFQPQKGGMPMDWVYFSEQLPITAEVISTEKNIEKRRALMAEYGIANYLSDIKLLDKHPSYGELISANVEGEQTTQKFLRLRNGTVEPEENQQFLRERNMLTEDNHKIYYLAVPDEIQTAKEGVEWSWDLPKGILPEAGWDYET